MENSMASVGSSTLMGGSGCGVSLSETRLADVGGFDSGQRDDVARARLFDLQAAQALGAIELGDLRHDLAAVQPAEGDLLSLAHAAVEDPTDEQAPHVVVVVQGGDQKLERGRRVEGRRRDGLEDLVEEGDKRLVRTVRRRPAQPLARIAVEDRKVQLRPRWRPGR